MGARHRDGQRQSIGDTHVEGACSTLNRACQKEAALFASRRFDREEVFPWLFTPDTLAKARAVRGMITPDSSSAAYKLANAQLTIQYNKQYSVSSLDAASVPTINEEFFQPQEGLVDPLLDHIEVIRGIYYKWAAVKHMLRWFNREATPGAIRNYWPAVLQLCPEAPPIREFANAAPTRFTAPKQIGSMLPLIRDTAATVAGMALLPADALPHTGGNLRLTFHEHEVTYFNNSPDPIAAIKTDTLTFHI